MGRIFCPFFTYYLRRELCFYIMGRRGGEGLMSFLEVAELVLKKWRGRGIGRFFWTYQQDQWRRLKLHGTLDVPPPFIGC